MLPYPGSAYDNASRNPARWSMASDESPAAGHQISPPPPHVLLLPLPFQGHINPFIELGNRLASSGLRVTLLTIHHVHTKLLRSQALLQQSSASAAPTDHPSRLLSFAYLPDSLPDNPLLSDILQATETILEDAALDFVLSLAAEGRPVTCIISDFLLRSSLASGAGLPEFALVTHCLSTLAMLLQIDAFIAAGYDPFDTSDCATGMGPDQMESAECIAGLPRRHFRYADLPFQGTTWKMSAAWQEERIRRRLKELPSSKGFLVNSCTALEGEAYRALANAPGPLRHLPHPNFIRMIGPLLPPSPSEARGSSLLEEEADECMQWLDGQPTCSVVYVAFGSVARMDGNEQLKELARGLLDSGQRFLWVLRKDATSSFSDRSENSLPLGFLEQVKELRLGKIVNWAPQVRVLSHRAVGGFFSHCGWNSILESINAGVSILGWPYMMDQFPNCRLVSHVWKMGLELKRDPLNRTTSLDVSHAVLELLQGPCALLMRSNACKLKKLVHEALDSSCELLAFMEAIIHLSN